MSLSEELKKRMDEHSPHRLAYYEALLNRIASEVAGNAKFHGERTAAIVDEIDGLRKEFKELRERVDRMAAFLNQLKKGNGNG